MTKLKNTKKGMAKKALSVSLVAAMLATSNVPVWAAEDLFTDGSSAAVEAPAAEVETFSSEPTEVETPVVEDATNNVATYAASEVKMSLTDWGSNDLTFEGDLKDSEGNVITGTLNYEFRLDDKEIVGHTGTYKGTASSLAEISSKFSGLTADDVGKKLTLNITAANGFSTTLGPIEVKAIDITGRTGFGIGNAALVYTGKQVAFTDEQIKGFTFTGDLNGLTYEDFTYSYEGEDLVNVTQNGKTITVIATINRPGYTGSVKVEGCGINQLPIVAEDLEIVLNKKSVSYAEKDTISSDMVTVKNKKTGETYPTSTYTVEASGLTIDTPATLTVKFTDGSLAKDKKTNRNYKVDGDVTKATEEKVTLTANNMSDFRVVADSAKKDGFDVNKAKSSIHFYLGDKEVTDSISSVLTYNVGSISENATSVSVVVSGDNKNILGSTTVTINLTANEIVKSALNLYIDGVEWYETKSAIADVTYTGEEITREVKNVKLIGGSVTDTLTADDYKIEYVGDRTNAEAVSGKKVSMYIVGIGKYSGRVKLGEFSINPAEIKADDITVPETVQYDGSFQSAEEYMDGKVTVKANTTINGKDAKIDVPADAYTLKYKADKLEVGGKITTTLTNDNIKNKNFRVDNATISKTDATLISNKNIADENVKIEVVGGPYTYTGEAVVPSLKVTVDGVELALDRDYEVKTSTNSINAGTASVTVVGKGDYSGSQVVTYTINKANLSDVKAEAKVSNENEKLAFTYTGSQIKPKASNFKITLNGVELDSSDFAITYPTTSAVNVDAGEATVTLVPVKGNENFTGDKLEVKFNILPRKLTADMLAGKFYAFDETGAKIEIEDYTFAYDGTEKTFEDIEFVPSKNEYNDMTLVEGKDYEIKYFNNITGPEAFVYVAGIGNYTSTTKFSGSEVTYTVSQRFNIDGVTIRQSDMKLEDTEYGGGKAVTPNLTITVGSRTLVEGTDYEFTGLSDNAEVTPDKKVLSATLKMKGAYKLNPNKDAWTGAYSYNAKDETLTISWKIVKKDLANTEITAVKEGTDLQVTVINNGVIVPSNEYTVKENEDNTVTVSAADSSKNYTGSQTVSYEEKENEVGAPVIKEVKVNGNKATVILEGETDGATGYDYVISTVNDYQNGRLPNGINKNQLVTETSYQYLDQGIYYAYCHAWTRDENGNKVFGEWSNIMPFSVSAITPEKPTITSVKKSGRNVTVTWTQCDDAQGYDVVLGTAVRKVNGELRPVEYGKAVKKVGKNTYSVTFKSCPKGATFYAGLHAWNRTSETGVKVFSPWSDSVKVTI